MKDQIKWIVLTFGLICIVDFANDHLPWRLCETEKLIIEVGGCDALGECGVLYQDGTDGHRRLPVKNQYVCTSRFWGIPRD